MTEASAFINIPEIITRIIKYIIEGLAVAVVASLIPRRSLDLEDIAVISLTAATMFSILDAYIPSMGAVARDGAGLGMGLKLVGF
jgi:threonine/homoserine efflux transporter RhtA